jgi:Xaa-Pro aminopeptidase
MQSIFRPRVDRLLARLEAEGLDALLVTHLVNMRYLSGFNGSAGALLLTAGGQYLLTDFRYLEKAAAEADRLFEVVDISGLDYSAATLPTLLHEQAAIGYEAEHVSVALFQHWEAASVLHYRPTLGWVEELRAIKEPREVELIRASTRLTERIFVELLGLVGNDTAEADLAAEIEFRARKYGAEACSFSPIIASGERSSQPHAGFSRQRLTLDGYCSDMTRTVFYKSCPPRWEQLYNVVNTAKDLAFAAIRPGIPARDVDAVARQYITAHGYGEAFRHGLGHGVGMPFKGAPILHWTSADVLQMGHVASNEPGIYLPGEGGIRIEDLFVVTETGADNLNELSCEVTVVG